MIVVGSRHVCGLGSRGYREFRPHPTPLFVGATRRRRAGASRIPRSCEWRFTMELFLLTKNLLTLLVSLPTMGSARCCPPGTPAF